MVVILSKDTSKDTSKAILSREATSSKVATNSRDTVDKATSNKDTVSREVMASSSSLFMFSNSDLIMVAVDIVQPCK